MHPEVCQLAELLDKAQALLTKYGEKHWSTWLSNDARLIRNSDFYGVEHLLSAFGGMGSINDMMFDFVNGDQIQENEIDIANTELRSLLSEAYALATKLHSEKSRGK